MNTEQIWLPEMIEYGNTTALPSWYLLEKKATGYSRIYYVKKGDVHYEDAYDSITLKPGMLYLLPDTLPYRADRNVAVDFRCLYLHLIFFSLNISRLTEIPVPEGGALHATLTAMERCIDEKKPELLSMLCAAFPHFIKDLPQITHTTPMMTQVIAHINAHIHEEISIKQLSHLTIYHPNYFIRIFRRETGLPPHQFILRMRMQKARILLQQGMSVGDTAQAVGYADAASFARAFRAHYGVTPLHYAKGRSIAL